MKRPRVIVASTLAILALGLFWMRHSSDASPSNSGINDCQAVIFANKNFTECIATPGKHAISMRITGSHGIIYRGFPLLAKDIDTSHVAFAMNAGMYDAGSRPIGYYSENKNRLYPINDKSGDGNFYLKPNGVFFGDKDGNWHVLTTEEFAAQVNRRPEFGTQSGPMLLVGGELGASISPNGTSLNIRNAVGIDKDGRAHFVISDEPVSFGTMAAMMRDHAKTPNALYLDGFVSSLWNPATGRMDHGYPLGPLVLIERKTRAPVSVPNATSSN